MRLRFERFGVIALAIVSGSREVENADVVGGECRTGYAGAYGWRSFVGVILIFLLRCVQERQC